MSTNSPSQRAGPYFKCFGTIASLPAGKYDTFSNESRERPQKNLAHIPTRARPPTKLFPTRAKGRASCSGGLFTSL